MNLRIESGSSGLQIDNLYVVEPELWRFVGSA